MRFVPYGELGETPNIVVDGAGNAASRLVLSHWPRSGTPASLKADVSAEIVFRYLDRPDLRVEADAVSNNHFDEDGLIGVYALLHPAEALGRRRLLIEAAEAGDFGRFQAREAARIALTIAALADAERSPLGSEIFELPYPAQTAALYRELLPRLPEIVGDLERFRALWAEEDALLARSEAAIRSGRIRIEEDASLDLAVVTLAEPTCHPMALHSATERSRLLTIQGRTYELRYRYESWVQHVSRRPAPRVDLAALAERLSQDERPGARWTFDGVDAIAPSLRLEGADESRIPPEPFAARVKAFLAAAPPAWDPYD